MCGILGVVSRQRDLNPDLLHAMRDTMRHRGPDGAGLWISVERDAALANRRLAIIDLSPAGRQPMSDHTGRLWVTFNGEIYNYLDLRKELQKRGHTFRTASDTEVILEAYRAWGTDCLSRLNGMFAFGLYDSAVRRLFLARDRAGEKPLYYRRVPGELAFASELKALMADPAFRCELDLHALEYYLTFGYVPGERCILKGVSKLSAGHAMTYDMNSDVLRVWRYWQLPEPPRRACESPDELIEELETLLGDSVRRQLIADVPVGILLSGGTDSGLVTAMAARVSSKPVKTFTISFPGYGVYDESLYARLVAKHFGTQHTELAAEPTTLEILPQLARQYDEPMADSSMVPMYLVSRLVRQHATVALGGDGGDELFGGYLHYSRIQWQERVRRLVPSPLRELVRTGAGRVLPTGLKGRNYIIGLMSDLADSISNVNVFFDHVSRFRLLSALAPADGWSNDPPEAYKAAFCQAGYTPVQQATRVDFQTTLVDAYLVKVDRASMLASLEVRAPWLDHLIIEFAFGRVPDALKATDRERKILSRRLAKRLLPSEIDLSRKQGFSIPLETWLKGEWGRYVEEILFEADSVLFNRREIQALIAGQRRGYSNTNRLFALTMFELWRREYRVAV